MILLIHPPVAKPCEPPAGIARLSGMLVREGIAHRVFDANLEGLLHLAGTPLPRDGAEDTWTRGAFRNRERNVASLRDPGLYRIIDRYSRSVRDLGRVLSTVSPPGTSVGLANYKENGLSPVRSRDLLRAAEHPESNAFYPFFRSHLLTIFREKEPVAAGISVNYLSQALCAFSMIGFLRQAFPRLKIILGGGLITSWVKSACLKNSFEGLVDHLVAGPGEEELMRLLAVKNTTDGMPRPDYRALPWERYLAPGFILPYSGSTGCYWNRCDFCPEQAEGNPFRPVSPKQVASDLQVLAEKTDPVLCHLLDNAIPPALLDALCIKEASARWYGFTRISRRLTDPGFCRDLKKAGCVMLKLGIESADQAVLDSLHKGIKVEQAAAVLRNLKKAGIGTYVYLLFGTPEETEASARKTLAFTVENSANIDFLNLALFNMPISGWNGPKLETKPFYEGDLSLYTGFSHPLGWDRKRVRLFLDREFKRHPVVSAILKNDPPVFTSNHAPFFVKE